MCIGLRVCAWPAEDGSEGELLKDVVFYALDSRQESILWDVKPSFVVVYDPDITFVRQLEVRICSTGSLLHRHSPPCSGLKQPHATLQTLGALAGSLFLISSDLILCPGMFLHLNQTFNRLVCMGWPVVKGWLSASPNLNLAQQNACILDSPGM